MLDLTLVGDLALQGPSQNLESQEGAFLGQQRGWRSMPCPITLSGGGTCLEQGQPKSRTAPTNLQTSQRMMPIGCCHTPLGPGMQPPRAETPGGHAAQGRKINHETSELTCRGGFIIACSPSTKAFVSARKAMPWQSTGTGTAKSCGLVLISN